MPLPSPQQIGELLTILGRQRGGATRRFGTFTAVKAHLKAVVEEAASNARTNGAGFVFETALGASGGIQIGNGAIPSPALLASPVSLPLFSVGAALGPWLAAVDIIRQAPRVFELYDLRNHARGAGGAHYRCSCGKCADTLQYMIDKKERKITVLALSPFLAGLPALAYGGWSVAKSFQRGRPKEMRSRQLVDSANGGCVSAAATIMMLCDNRFDDAIAIMLAEDGWLPLKHKW